MRRGKLLVASFLLLASCNSQNEIQRSQTITKIQTPEAQPSLARKKTGIVEPPRISRKTGGNLTKATDLYQDLYVTPGTFEIQLNHKPWSGYWLPFLDNYLFRDENAPLRKYDQYVKNKTGVESKAADTEAARRYYDFPEAWAGRCDAWAAASVFEREPQLEKPVTVNGVTFTRGDLKSLLTLIYEDADGFEYFGDRFNGNYYSAPLEDMYPDQFHKIMQRELFENQRMFVMDKDLTTAVWNVPIYWARTEITKDPRLYLLHVVTTVVGEPPAMSPEEEEKGVKRSNAQFRYTYDLYGSPQPDGRFKVSYGVWTGESIEVHPDYAWTLYDNEIRHDIPNKEINLDVIRDIVREVLKKAAASRLSLIEQLGGL